MQPLRLVFEDLHWIDTETQALLDSLVESLPTARLLLLVNYRPEYQHGWGSKTYYMQLRLDPLPPASTNEFLQARIVEVLEGLYADRLDEQVERLAHHAFQGEVWDKACTYYRQAGAKALEQSAYPAVEVSSEQALAASAHPHDARRSNRRSICAWPCAQPSSRFMITITSGCSPTCTPPKHSPRHSTISGGLG